MAGRPEEGPSLAGVLVACGRCDLGAPPLHRYQTCRARHRYAEACVGGAATCQEGLHGAEADRALAWQEAPGSTGRRPPSLEEETPLVSIRRSPACLPARYGVGHRPAFPTPTSMPGHAMHTLANASARARRRRISEPRASRHPLGAPCQDSALPACYTKYKTCSTAFLVTPARGGSLLSIIVARE